MFKINLEGFVEEANVINLKEVVVVNSIASDGRIAGYTGELSIKLRTTDKTNEIKMRISVSNPFETRLITNGLKGQKVIYNEERGNWDEGSFVERRLQVLSGTFEGLEYKTDKFY